MSNLADVGTGLPIHATPGFRYGDSATGGTPIVGLEQVQSVTPTLETLSKAFTGPENETATGPNYVREYVITYAWPDDQTLGNIVFSDTLPISVQFLSATVTPVAPATNCRITQTPSTTVPGGLMEAQCDQASGGSIELRIEFWVPEFDANGAPILEEDLLASGGCVQVANDVDVTSDWDPLDGRDQIANLSDNAANVFDACALAIQKGGGVFVDNFPVGAGPTDVLSYTYEIQVSDYFVFGGDGASGGPFTLPPAGAIVITDTVGDGQIFDPTFLPVYAARDRTGQTTGVFTPTAPPFDVAENLIVDENLQPARHAFARVLR